MAGSRHTFLFTDLVGFTALAASHGDDRAADVALEFYERVRPLLKRHGAEEIKAIGDALMIRCEDPCLAIQLGLRIVSELDEDPDFPAVRVGVHTGTAVNREGDWYGAGVNVAARLCAAAGGGDVLVSEATREAAEPLRRVELGERRLHWLKNVSDPLPARAVSIRQCLARAPRRVRLAKARLAQSIRPRPEEAIP
jgi:class 3 adenylate cyclase